MVNSELKPHIEDILKILEDYPEKELKKEEIEKELEKFLEYGVPIDQAKQTLIKKYGGGDTPSTSNSERTLISDLRPNQSSVNLLCKLITINPKDITVKGENRRIFYGIIGDESGTIPFTAWNEIDVERGDVIKISNAYTKEWQGNIQLNFGNRVNIQKTDDDKLPKDAFKPKEYKIEDLKSGIGSVQVTAKIIEMEKRETEIDGNKKNVISGIIGDETGKAQFTSWHDFKFKKGDVVKIKGGYIKTWKGIPQLTFDENSKVEQQDKKLISKDVLDPIKMPLYKIVEKRGGLDITTQGTIIEVRPGSGFIMRCSKCDRALVNGECHIHGPIDGKPDLRIKLFVDDGTGSASTIIGREISEKLLGKTIDEVKEMGDETNNELNKLLFCKRISIRGNILGDKFGLSIIASDAKFLEFNVIKESEKLLHEIEDLQ